MHLMSAIEPQVGPASKECLRIEGAGSKAMLKRWRNEGGSNKCHWKAMYTREEAGVKAADQGLCKPRKPEVRRHTAGTAAEALNAANTRCDNVRELARYAPIGAPSGTSPCHLGASPMRALTRSPSL